MKLFTTTLIIIFLVSTAIAAIGVITAFDVNPEDGQAVLDWKTGLESEVISFEVQRSFDNKRFYAIATISPLGNNHSYRFVDRDLFKDQVHTYYYRISVALSNGNHQVTETQQVILTTSGIQQTWGSIKAMFR